MGRKFFKISDSVVAVLPKHVDGPGWGNTPIWIIIRDKVGNLREECLQPDEQSAEMHILFDVVEAANKEMIAATTCHLFNHFFAGGKENAIHKRTGKKQVAGRRVPRS